MFYHMGWRTDKQQADALYYLVMSVFGHGIGLDDDHSEMLTLAERNCAGRFPPPGRVSGAVLLYHRSDQLSAGIRRRNVATFGQRRGTVEIGQCAGDKSPRRKNKRST